MSRTPRLPIGYTLAPMRDEDINQLAEWAAIEGWNPGRSDLAIARRIDPNAFIALRDGDQLVGGGTVFRITPSFGFMGLFIIRADRRGAGLGRALWHHRRDRRQRPAKFPCGKGGTYSLGKGQSWKNSVGGRHSSC